MGQSQRNTGRWKYAMRLPSDEKWQVLTDTLEELVQEYRNHYHFETLAQARTYIKLKLTYQTSKEGEA